MEKRLPKSFMEDGEMLAKHVKFYGMDFENMTHEELKAVAATGWYVATFGAEEDEEYEEDLSWGQTFRWTLSTIILWTLAYVGVFMAVEGAMNSLVFITVTMGIASVIVALANKPETKEFAYGRLHYIRDIVIVIALTWPGNYVAAIIYFVGMGASMDRKRKHKRIMEARKHVQTDD